MGKIKENPKKQELLLYLLAGVPSFLYWGSLALLAWVLVGVCRIAIGGVIAIVVVLALSMAKVSGECSRMEDEYGRSCVAPSRRG